MLPVQVSHAVKMEKWCSLAAHANLVCMTGDDGVPMHEPRQFQGETRQKSDGCDTHFCTPGVSSQAEDMREDEPMHEHSESGADRPTLVTCGQSIGHDALGRRQRQSLPMLH